MGYKARTSGVVNGNSKAFCGGRDGAASERVVPESPLEETIIYADHTERVRSQLYERSRENSCFCFKLAIKG